MDAGMYEAAATQANVATLKERGVLIAGPTTGRMASGMAGLGRFLEPEQVLGHARMALGMRGPLRGRRVVVSAGPTQEPIDPVRFLSNGSSGKQGFAIAQAAVDYGAETILISGPVGLSTPVGVQRIDVGTAIEMQEAVLAYACGAPPAHALIMASAVGDFRPAHPAAQKVKKEREDLLTLPLARNPDILMTVAGHSRRPRVVVGFAAESEDLLDNAREKMARKKLDMIVANNVTAPDAGFGVDTNRVHFLAVQGERDLGLMSKMGVAYEIMEWLTKQDA
jgi:phosphopantothenoylcysteine decarboxylase/phosphopantothenate--cysteine ligase